MQRNQYLTNTDLDFIITHNRANNANFQLFVRNRQVKFSEHFVILFLKTAVLLLFASFLA